MFTFGHKNLLLHTEIVIINVKELKKFTSDEECTDALLFLNSSDKKGKVRQEENKQ